MIGYGCILLLIWVRRLLIVGNGFSMGLRVTTTTRLLASRNSWNELPWIVSVMISKKTHGLRQRTYRALMTFITKALNCSSSSPLNSEISTILEIKIDTATTTDIGRTASKEIEKERGGYKRSSRGYYNRRLHNGRDV